MTMKQRLYNIALILVGALALTACSSYEVGDWYNHKGIKGVVLMVDDEGQPTLLVSPDEAVDLTADSALLWAAQLDAATEAQVSLPSKEEMEWLHSYSAVVNKTLRTKGKSTLLEGNTFYWTSTPCSESHYYAHGPDGVRCYYRGNQSSCYRACALIHLDK